MLDDGALRPSQLGGSASKALRRNVIDAAAWTRDFLYVLAGHCAVAVIVLKPSSQALPSPQCLRPDHFDPMTGSSMLCAKIPGLNSKRLPTVSCG